jgi:hypothetical protein
MYRVDNIDIIAAFTWRSVRFRLVPYARVNAGPLERRGVHATSTNMFRVAEGS